MLSDFVREKSNQVYENGRIGKKKKCIQKLSRLGRSVGSREGNLGGERVEGAARCGGEPAQ